MITIKKNENNVTIKLDGSHNKANYQNYYITELSKKSAKYENETIYPYQAKNLYLSTRPCGVR